MKRSLLVSLVLGLFATGYVTMAGDSVVFKEVKALKVEGDVTVMAATGTATVAMQKDAVYPFGTTIKTGRASFADLELSPKNVFRVRASSTVLLQPNDKNPKLVALKLTDGEIESNLGAFPKGYHYEVQTPLAICGAVGTNFSVRYVYTQKNEVQIQVIDNEGNVTIRGDQMRLEGNGLKPGQMLVITLTKNVNKGWTVTASFTGIEGDSIMINLWGIREEITIPRKTDSAPNAPDGSPTPPADGGPAAGGSAAGGSTTTSTTTTSTVTVTVDLPDYVYPLPGDHEDKWEPPTPPPPLPPDPPISP